MSATTSGSEDVLYVFGPFMLDPVVGVLRRHGTIVPRPNKSLERLVILVGRCTHLDSRWDVTSSSFSQVPHLTTALKVRLSIPE
jgi:hypothetical protein